MTAYTRGQRGSRFISLSPGLPRISWGATASRATDTSSQILWSTRVSHSLRSVIRCTRFNVRMYFLLSFPLLPELNQTVTVQPDTCATAMAAVCVTDVVARISFEHFEKPARRWCMGFTLFKDLGASRYCYPFTCQDWS